MNGTFKNLTLISALLCFTAQANATVTIQAETPKSDTTILLERAQAGSGAATEELLANIENYKSGGGDKGAFENNLKARLKAIDSIWALGEIGEPRLMSRLSRFYDDSDDVLKINLIISMGKLKNNSKAGPYLFDIAADPRETEVVRAAAFELLEQIGYPSTVANLRRSATGIDKADLIYTGGIVGTVSGWFSPDLPIGHAGVFVGTEAKDGRINVVIADCVPNNFKPGGVRNINSWSNFTHQFKFPFYGHRTTAVKPTAAQRERIAQLGMAMGKKGLKYNDTHFTQKGPVEFDCVGYTEFLYESAGLNPTPDAYETGAGWPLTPWEQFIAVVPPPAGPASPIVAPNQHIVTPNLGILNNAFGALDSAFGRKSADLPEVPADIQPEIID